MAVEIELLIAWILFGGTHILGSVMAVRTRLIRALGLLGFKGVYSLVALATFAPLVWIALHNRHVGPPIWNPPGWAQHATEVLMLPALLFVALAVATPGPATTLTEMSGRSPAPPRGVQRISRHPMNTGFALFGLAHMFSNPTTGDWIFWGGWVVFAVASALHQDRRALASGPGEFRAFYAETSFVPFVAMLQGRQRLVPGEFPWPAVVAALALYALIRWLHPTLIGGFG